MSVTLESYTIGTAGRDYSTMAAFETAQQENYVTAKVAKEGVCYNDSVFDEAFEINGSTTSAIYFLRFCVAPGNKHTETPGTGVRLKYTGAYNEAIAIKDNFIQIKDISFITGSSAAVPMRGINVNDVTGTGDANEIKIIGCMFDGEDSTGGRGIIVNDADAIVKIINCSFQGITNNSVTSAGVYVLLANTVYIYNCTMNLNKYGVKRDAGTVICKNCAAFSNATADFSGTFDTVNSRNNVSSDASAPGSGSQTMKTAADNFYNVSAGTEDFRILDVDADIYGRGIDLSEDSAYAFSMDILDNTRNGWDVGAFAFATEAESDIQTFCSQMYSIHKFGLMIIETSYSFCDINIDIGDEITVNTGNPSLSLSAIVFNVKRDLARRRIIVKALVGGFLLDEDQVWN